MNKIIFYEDIHGYSPVKELIEKLNKESQSDKKSRVKLKQIMMHIDYVELFGTRINSKVIEHIQGDLWQIRPGRIRIFLFHWKEDQYILLHDFIKKTRKTPEREIERALCEINDWVKRHPN